MEGPGASQVTSAVDDCLELYRSQRHHITVFGNSVREFIATHPMLSAGDMPVVHSVRFRVKHESHLVRKLERKAEEGRHIDASNFFQSITDLAGVRILHLHLEQASTIHEVINRQVEQGHWALFEPPKAYTWDPEASGYFAALGLNVLLKESHYTSVHYVVKPNPTLPVCCEIQVRTLFEEVWGEVDHLLNYPFPTSSIACREQLLVLAKMVGAGTRLTQAIFRSHSEFVTRGAENNR